MLSGGASLTASIFTVLDSQRTSSDLLSGCCPGWDALGQQGGAGVEFGRADVLIVRDRTVIVRIDIIEGGGNASEGSAEATEGCLNYECKEAQDPRERGPYEVAKGCVRLSPIRG